MNADREPDYEEKDWTVREIPFEKLCAFNYSLVAAYSRSNKHPEFLWCTVGKLTHNFEKVCQDSYHANKFTRLDPRKVGFQNISADCIDPPYSPGAKGFYAIGLPRESEMDALIDAKMCNLQISYEKAREEVEEDIISSTEFPYTDPREEYPDYESDDESHDYESEDESLDDEPEQPPPEIKPKKRGR